MSRQKKQFIAVARHGEDIPGIDLDGKQLTKDEFMQKIEFVNVYRTSGSH